MKNIIIKLTAISILSITYTTLIGQTTEDCILNESGLVPEFQVVEGIVPMDTALYSYEQAPDLPGDTDDENNESYLDSLLRNRIIFWAHGLGGDEESWRPAMNNVSYGSKDGTFPARDVHNYTMKYTNGNLTMRDCAITLGQGLREKTILHHQDSLKKHFNMIIAHSQGGIVSRTLNQVRENERIQDFGGLVFFTVAHQGAYILESAKNGAGGIFSEWACNLLAAPYMREEIEKLNWFVQLLIDEDEVAKSITETFCSGASNVVNFLLNKIANEAQTDDYLPGAQHLKDLTEYELDSNRKFKTHRVNFFSEEPDEGYLIWRTLNYQYNSSLIFDNFGANADDGPGTLKQEIDDLHENYLNEIEKHKNNQQRLNCHTWWNEHIWNGEACDDYAKLEKLFKNALTFFEDSNNRWKVIIGARYLKNTGICEILGHEYEEIDEFGNGYGRLIPFQFIYEGIETDEECDLIKDDFIENNSYLHNIESLPRKIWEEIPSDGIVTLESQANLPGHNVINQKIYNSSHMQIRNDDNLKQSLMKLFRGELNDEQQFLNSQRWFKTPTKN